MPHKDPEARRAYQKAYRIKNREKINAWLREYKRTQRMQNRDEINARRSEYRRSYRAENPELVRAQERAYRAENRDKINARLRESGRGRESTRKYHANNRDKINARSRELRAQDPERHKEYDRRYREAHKEQRSADSRVRSARYYAENRDRLVKWQRDYNQQNGEKIRERAKQRYQALSPEQRRTWHLKPKHGIEFEDLVAMLDAQYGLCYLCNKELDPLRAVIDHDHSCCPAEQSCLICRRGLACSNCNSITGMAGDEPVRLRHIADALEKASREMLDRGEPISRVISAKPETCPECGWLPNAAARQPAHSVAVHRAKKHNAGSVSKKERMWIWRLQFKHGMQPEDWTAMLNAQQGLCYLCGEEFGSRKIVIEHDHSCCPAEESCSACRRGLACTNCNSVIGLAGDDYARLRIMADVLEAAKEAVEQRKSDAAIAASLPRPRRSAASRPGKRGERVEPPAGPQASPGLRS